MSYRVLIPTAGTGSRLGNLTKYINKALVGIANRPTICHIIEQFDKDAEFVIALGHKGHLVREFLELAYPKRRFLFAEVNPFEGQGSGLGLSVLSCQEFLQQPFIFISCDTLVREKIPSLEENWMGYSKLTEFEPYRTLEVKKDQVKDICEKGKGKINTHHPYIGLAGIRDYKIFWDAMKQGGKEVIAVGEAYGMRALLHQGIRSYCFTWFDTGNPQALAETREVFKEDDAPNILEKANEAIWFVNGEVIKFSDDENFIANRVARVCELKDFVPQITGSTRHMYRYPKAEGKVFSEIVTVPLFEKLLERSKVFWEPCALSPFEHQDFKKTCMRFYRDKTKERVELFYKNFGKKDGTETINGIHVSTLKELLDAVDWDWIADGLPGRFHGDFHFENILYSSHSEVFIFLDWRQEFGGSLTTGDVYYDLAKLQHGMIICHELIAQERFHVKWQNGQIQFDFERKPVLVDSEEYFLKWVSLNGYEPKKVRILTALIYLNIAALHHYPYCLLLYALGKGMLDKELGKENAFN